MGAPSMHIYNNVFIDDISLKLFNDINMIWHLGANHLSMGLLGWIFLTGGLVNQREVPK